MARRKRPAAEAYIPPPPAEANAHDIQWRARNYGLSTKGAEERGKQLATTEAEPEPFEKVDSKARGGRSAISATLTREPRPSPRSR